MYLIFLYLIRATIRIDINIIIICSSSSNNISIVVIIIITKYH